MAGQVRNFEATATIWENVSTKHTFTNNDKIKSFEVSRTGEDGKFFGFGIVQKLSLKLIDPDRELNWIEANQPIEITLTDANNNRSMSNFPYFIITEIHRDEITNELSITAYDGIYFFKDSTYATIVGFEAPYTIKRLINITVSASLRLFDGSSEKVFSGVDFRLKKDKQFLDFEYPEGANFSGNETLRQVLDAAAEATGCIYYASGKRIIFQLITNYEQEDTYPWDIIKDDYFNLKLGTRRVLGAICATNELGDSYIIGNKNYGTTQYIRSNPFLDNRVDITQYLNPLWEQVEQMKLQQHNLDWVGFIPRSNIIPALGTQYFITNKDNEVLPIRNYGDVLSYDGSFKVKQEWYYEDTNDRDSAENPITLGDKLKDTFAKVDKANKTIDLVVADVEANKESISQLSLTANEIKASVGSVEQLVNESTEGINSTLGELSKKVDATMSAEDIRFTISTELKQSGVATVTTSTGYKFDDEGLTISKSGSEMSTQITEDGMQVYRDNTAVLTANNTGVVARNLHAETYLIIGNTSRFEDYIDVNGEARTGCFWIGG